MQYSVPQFVDVESKIIGPISVRQFVIMAVAIGLIFLFYRYADLSFFIFASVVIFLASSIFAFVRINGMPFHFFFLNFLQSIKNPKLRVWKKEGLTVVLKKKASKKSEREEAQVNYIKIASRKEKIRSRLSDLSLLVDTGGYHSEKNEI